MLRQHHNLDVRVDTATIAWNSGSTRGGGLEYACLMEKKMAGILLKLRAEPGLSEHERLLFARSLAASPDERWRLHENFLRSHDLFTRSSRKKYGFKSLE